MRVDRKTLLDAGHSPEFQEALNPPGYQPNKPRLLLEPQPNQQAEIDAFFTLIKSDPMVVQNMKRIYDHVPGIPVATLEHVRTIYGNVPDHQHPWYLTTAQSRFRAQTDRLTCRLSSPSLQIIRYDNNPVVAACFKRPKDIDRFQRLRHKLLTTAWGSLGVDYLQTAEQAPTDLVARLHDPMVTIPLMRPYAVPLQQATIATVRHAFATHFPKTIKAAPRLVPPALDITPELPPTPSHIHQLNQTFDHNPGADRLDDESYLLHRAVKAASQYTNASVTYYYCEQASASLTDNELAQKAAGLGNLSCQAITNGPSYMHIRF